MQLRNWILIFTIVFSFVGYAQDKNKDESSVSIRDTEEFNTALKEEVGKYVAKIGRGNLAQYTKDLMEKEEKLKLRAHELDDRENKILLNEKDFSKRVEDFHKSTSRIIGCMDETEDNKNKRLQHIVDVISGMRPQIAAEMLSVQDADISVQVLDKLDSVKVSKIFNLMDKEISARLQKQYMNMKK